MANTLSNTHRVLDRKIKELEQYSPHKSQLIKSLKVNKENIEVFKALGKNLKHFTEEQTNLNKKQRSF